MGFCGKKQPEARVRSAEGGADRVGSVSGNSSVAENAAVPNSSVLLKTTAESNNEKNKASLVEVHESLGGNTNREQELECLQAIDWFRENPASFVPKIARWHTKKPRHITLREGEAAIMDAERELSSLQQALPMLSYSPGLSLAALSLAWDLGSQGKSQHWSAKHASPVGRMDRFGTWTGSWGESVAVGNYGSGSTLMEAIVIDDNVPSRSNRHNVTNSKFTKIGLAIARHAKRELITVLLFAEDYTENPSAQKEFYREFGDGKWEDKFDFESDGLKRSTSNSEILGIEGRRGRRKGGISFHPDTKLGSTHSSKKNKKGDKKNSGSSSSSKHGKHRKRRRVRRSDRRRDSSSSSSYSDDDSRSSGDDDDDSRSLGDDDDDDDDDYNGKKEKNKSKGSRSSKNNDDDGDDSRSASHSSSSSSSSSSSHRSKDKKGSKNNNSKQDSRKAKRGSSSKKDGKNLKSSKSSSGGGRGSKGKEDSKKKKDKKGPKNRDDNSSSQSDSNSSVSSEPESSTNSSSRDDSSSD